jgi:hypothetical protein
VGHGVEVVHLIMHYVNGVGGEVIHACLGIVNVVRHHVVVEGVVDVVFHVHLDHM